MGEQVKLLKKENQDLKKQLPEIQTNLISIQKEVNYEKQHGAGKNPTINQSLFILGFKKFIRHKK